MPRATIRTAVLILAGLVVHGGTAAAQTSQATGPAIPAPGPVIAPVTGLPGPSTAWSNGALDLIALLNKNDIGGPLIDRFVEAGGLFKRGEREKLDGTEAIYSTHWSRTPTIFISPSQVNDDGFFPSGLVTKALVATVTHEVWHAYWNQVVEAGYDPTTKGIFDNAVGWLGDQELKPAEGGDEVPATSVLTDSEALADFTDEYIGALIDDMVIASLKIQQSLEDGDITEEEAERRWQQYLDGLAKTPIQAYKDASATIYTVLAPPPGFLIDHLIGILDLYPIDAPATQQTSTNLGDDVFNALGELEAQTTAVTVGPVQPEIPRSEFDHQQTQTTGEHAPQVQQPQLQIRIEVVPSK